MLDWAKKVIYSKCQSIADKLRTRDDERAIREANKIKNRRILSGAPDVLAGETPWKIIKTELGAFSVYTYCYDDGSWEDICCCSDRVVGVHQYEIRRVMQEKFGANIYGTGYNYPSFDEESEAQAFIDDIASYYDDYHLPRAMMDRMMLYNEGGYPPYFAENEKCPSQEEVDEEVNKRVEAGTMNVR